MYEKGWTSFFCSKRWVKSYESKMFQKFSQESTQYRFVWNLKCQVFEICGECCKHFIVFRNSENY